MAAITDNLTSSPGGNVRRVSEFELKPGDAVTLHFRRYHSPTWIHYDAVVGECNGRLCLLTPGGETINTLFGAAQHTTGDGYQVISRR